MTLSKGFDAFGNATNAAFPSRYQFTGREFDSFTGLQFSRARFYDPRLGRFISEDPISFGGGDVNLYGYVGNRPLARRDPTGLFPNTIAADPGTLRLGAAAMAALGVLAPPLGVAAVGGAAIYVSWQLGEEIARHPSNPLSRPWVSPDVIRPPLAPPASRPYCIPMAPVVPFPTPKNGPLVPPPPPPTSQGPPDRFSRCKSAYEDCKASSGGDYRMEALCALSYGECIRNPDVPVVFPNGIWVP